MLHGSELKDTGTYTILDASGRIVYSVTDRTMVHQIPTARLSPGSYLIKVNHVKPGVRDEVLHNDPISVTAIQQAGGES